MQTRVPTDLNARPSGRTIDGRFEPLSVIPLRAPVGAIRAALACRTDGGSTKAGPARRPVDHTPGPGRGSAKLSPGRVLDCSGPASGGLSDGQRTSSTRCDHQRGAARGTGGQVVAVICVRAAPPPSGPHPAVERPRRRLSGVGVVVAHRCPARAAGRVRAVGTGGTGVVPGPGRRAYVALGACAVAAEVLGAGDGSLRSGAAGPWHSG